MEEPDQSFDTTNLEELKLTLRNQLQTSGINNLIRDVVRDVCTTKKGGLKKLSSDDVIQEVYSRGLMKNVLDSFKAIAVPMSTQNERKVVIGDKGDSNSNGQLKLNTLLSRTGEVNNDNAEKDIETSNDEDQDEYDDDEFLPEPDGSESEKQDGVLDSNANPEVGKSSEMEGKEDETDVSNAEKISVFSEIIESEHQMIKMTMSKGPMHGKYYLKVEVLGGSAFLDHLFENNGDFDPPPGSSNTNTKSKFVLNVFYKSERFRSKSVKCCCEPDFKETFMLDIGYFEGGSILQLLAMAEQVRFVLLRKDAHGTGSLVISHRLYDWRPVLMSGTCSHQVSLELMGIGPEHKVPIGILNLRISILPSLQEQLSDSTYSAQLAMEKTRQDERDRLFLVYTKQWGREYMEIRPEHQKRLVKIFAYDENTISKPVITFVKPLVSDRLLPTPAHAAWFVSMFSVRDDPENLLQMKSSVAPRNPGRPDARHILSDHWQSLQSSISSKSGSVEDHAILLCSLLLGFGLDAYVAIGTKLGSEPWVWVVTFDTECLPTFWESLTGKELQHIPRPEGELPDERVLRLRQNEIHRFKSIDCIFNNKSFFANVQPSNLIERTEWNLTNPSKWKRIPECTIQHVPSNEFRLHLLPSTTSPIVISTNLELSLKLLVSDLRRHKGLNTRWDDQLSGLMGQELARYELEACTGVHSLPSHFETVIMKMMQPGYDFKGFPYHTVSNDPQMIFYDCLREKECKNIVYCRGLAVSLALRVDTFPYPEDITSIRVMFACKYMSAA